MSELPPIDEYVTIELWQETSGNVKWRAFSHTGQQPDPNVLERMILEMTESTIDRDKTNPVIFTLMTQEQGNTLIRWAPEKDYTTRRSYVRVKRLMHRAHWNMMGRQTDPHLAKLWWSLEWLYHKLRGHFNASLNTLPAARTRAAPSLTEMLSEQSEAVEKASRLGAGATGSVIPFPRGGKHG